MQFVRHLFILSVFIFVSGCQLFVIEGNLGGLTSNFRKTKKDCKDLICLDTQRIAPGNSTCKYVVTNGKALKLLLAQYDSSIVYLWSPGCKGQFCPSLNFVVNKFRTENKALFIVSEYYDCRVKTMQTEHNKPIFGIDTKYYKSNFTSKYLDKFLFDLTGISDMDVNADRLLSFSRDSFSKKYSLTQ